MIKSIHVKNLALIEDVSVDLEPGLNILTGETGAGKSIFIHSVYLLLGAKAGKEYIRTGADHAYVEASVCPVSGQTAAILKQLDIDAGGDSLILSRKISEGRSTARINGEVVTAGELRRAAASCMVLHGQQEQRQLLDEKRHRELLDDFAGNDLAKDLEDTAAAFENLSRAEKRFREEALSVADLERKKDLLAFEYRELTSASLREGEDDELEETYRLMQHARRIRESLSAVAEIVGGDRGIEELTDRAFRALSDASGLDPALAGIEDQLSFAQENLASVRRLCSDRLDELNYSEEEVQYTEERLNTLNHLKQKYRTDLKGLILLTDQKEKELAELDDLEAFRASLKEAFEKAEAVYEESAGRLSGKRVTAAREFEKRVIDELKDLNFLQSDFAVEIERASEPGPYGTDHVFFTVSMNPGEERKPLDLIASGGELSRIMLAVKTVLGDTEQADTLVFDEIDTGISGETAARVADKLKKIAEKRQVICITHLPQIAACGNAHFYIEKRVAGGRTETVVSRLDEEETVQELARMMGGTGITPAVLATARELREMNR